VLALVLAPAATRAAPPVPETRVAPGVPAPSSPLTLVGPPPFDDGLAVARVMTSEPVVALTFDACPTHRATGLDQEVFDFLRREKLPATVFVSGRWMASHWSDAQALAAEPLIELGNHSYAHPPFSTLTVDKGRAEILETERLIAQLGRRSVGFRPPYGDWAGWLPRETGGLPVVLWDVVSGDAGGHVPAPRMIETVTREARPGSIIIFHINGNGPLTARALPEIVRRLRARGLHFVSVSALLALRNATIVRAHPARYHFPPTAPPPPAPFEGG
jgi:peptidoglycan/xylan/chitin deacetylase (PgdA/CDA1 family)